MSHPLDDVGGADEEVTPQQPEEKLQCFVQEANVTKHNEVIYKVTVDGVDYFPIHAPKEQPEENKMVDCPFCPTKALNENSLMGHIEVRHEPYRSRHPDLPTPQEEPEEECEHKNEYATRCDEDCGCNLLHIICPDCDRPMNTVEADFPTFPPKLHPQEQWMEVARDFHDTYERLAPKFGYETRPDTKSFDPTSPNGKLMIAVIESVLTTQIEVARRESGKQSEYELARKVWSIAAYKDSDKKLVALLLPILEAGRATSLTNHN